MAASLHGQKILIVEDEPFIALDMEATLSSAGAEVISALQMEEAFEAAQNADISAAVLDVNLADGDCAPLCEVLAQRQKVSIVHLGLVGLECRHLFEHFPFIFHTGYVDGGPIDKWPRPVVAKPSTQDELLECLAGAISGR